MPTALISVSDKTGSVEFAQGLGEAGWSIVSTGGTAAGLSEAGIMVRSVSELTSYPEMLGGRVKTLHPVVHAGILARRSVREDLETLEEAGIGTIDLVAVNLYPFRKTISRSGVTVAEALEQIDIGGPTLLRAAAKNHPFVWAVCDPDDYERVLEALADPDGQEEELRRTLAAKVFRHTAAYDAAIAGYVARIEDGSPALATERLTALARVQMLRYGENPEQAAAFYRDGSTPIWGIPALEQLHGKELSYNNLLDVDGALGAVAPFLGGDRPACAIVKHTTPCGVAVGRSAVEAYQKALACDPLSAFGSVIAFTEPLSEAVAEALTDLFIECLIAPGYADSALQILEAKKNLRILRPERAEDLGAAAGHLWPGLDARGVRGGLLLQGTPTPVDPWGLRREPEVRVATSREPTEREWEDLGLAWAAIQSVKSNAILLARDGASIGIGAGQMSRVDSVRISIDKAAAAGHDVAGSVLASDAFFPFRDGIDAAAEAGVAAVIQPGGSIRDEEVIAAADEAGIAMVLTGRRLFRH